MLSAVKFIPSDQVQDDDLDSVSNDRKKSDSRRKKDKKKGKNFRNISSDEDELDKIKKSSRKKKWYSHDENSLFYTSESDSDQDDKKQRRKGKKKKGDGSSYYYSGERSESKRPAISETKEILPEKVPVEEITTPNQYLNNDDVGFDAVNGVRAFHLKGDGV
ncbi:hypothetical protein QL285_027846 [Trifolium repens]|nr:hypothetical protein QL285_027846 [Trifolium repens]